MPGIFSKSARPARPGAYFNWAATPVTTVLPSIGSVVLLAIVHDWGPDEVIVPTVSLADFQAKFGPTQSPGWKAVYQCFEGENYAGRGGAGTVLVYRMTGSAAVKATISIQNTTPAAAITLTAKYQGTYGNNLGYRNVADPSNVNNNLLQITLAGQVVESYSYAKTDINSLANQINASSQWVTAAMLITGVAIAAVSTSTPPTVLATGNDGLSLVGADWSLMMTNTSSARFSLFAPYDLTDSTILQSLQVWVANMNIAGKRFMAVVGGALNETASAAATRSTALQTVQTGATISAAEDFVNLGVGSVQDNTLPTVGGLGTTNFNILSTSQLAPRVAGILAARGESQSLTFARLAGVSPLILPDDPSVLQCFNAGVVCLGQDSNPDAPVRIEKGLTSYIGGDATKPYLIYRNPKFLRTMQGIELDITDWATNNAIGLLQVNDATRALVVGQAHEFIQARADRGVIQDGFSVATDPSPPPSDNDEFVALIYGIAFGRSVEQVFNTVYIS
jgi:hypothetical protein